ncbi:transposase [Sorangium sp. So ce136]|uniref:transposase n=1 Tax=Sorangium sp. So ce136 TaxID=3133284 RepID=UPI003F0A7153
METLSDPMEGSTGSHGHDLVRTKGCMDGTIVAAGGAVAAGAVADEAVDTRKDIQRQRLRIAELHIDRAYVNSPVVDDVIGTSGQVFSKTWGQRARCPDLFSERHFKIDLRAKTITCPAGQVEVFEPGDTVESDPEACGACPLRAKCTQAASGRGRTVSIAEDEAVQSKLRELQQTGAGRTVLRQRTAVEHALAHIAARKGHSARYIGTRRNLFDLRRAAAIQNLEAAQRLFQEAA